ncbi:MAG TPA: MFS transporter [Solirubrobacteraceae bacterium]|jgi:EmrB/QacA subfamily drug resistance transporter
MAAEGAVRPLTKAQQLTLLACILGSTTAFLDGTLVNVALPAIRADLGGGLATQQWIVDGYLLTLGSLLLVGGSLGDIFGRRRVFAAGVAGFGAASLLCALAPDAPLLVAARALQGVAGALLVPSTLALIMDSFQEHQRAAAIGAWTAWTGIATAIGPLAGGLLVELGSWRWIFVVNLPLVAATLWLLEHAPRGRASAPARVDWTGGLLAALGLGGPVFALIEQPRYGWSSGRVWPALVAGCALLVAFVVWERRSRAPMLPLQLFAIRNFGVGNLSTFAYYASLGTVTFFLVVFLQQVAGYSPLASGLSLMPLSVLMFLFARRFGALADRFGPRLFMGVGPLVTAAGLLWLLARVDEHASYASQILPGVVLFALGLALTVAPLTAAVLGSVGSGHSGVASGVNNAVARVAGMIAVAAVGAAVAGSFSSAVATRLPTAVRASAPAARVAERPFLIDASAFAAVERPAVRRALVGASLDAFRLAIGIAAALAAFSGLLSLLGISNRRRPVRAAQCAGGALVGASVDNVAEPVGAA